MLTGLQLKTYIGNISNEKQIQQVSIDLELISIEKIQGLGKILHNETKLPDYEIVSKNAVSDNNKHGWLLEPGYYKLTFLQSCEVPNNVAMQIIHRSSLLRSGCSITSAIYDPGFKCDNLGAFATIHNHIFIEKYSRVACIKGWETDVVDSNYLYNGQYQKK